MLRDCPQPPGRASNSFGLGGFSRSPPRGGGGGGGLRTRRCWQCMQGANRLLHKACDRLLQSPYHATHGVRRAACAAASSTPHATWRITHAARRTGFCMMGNAETHGARWCSTRRVGSLARIFPARIVQLPDLFVAEILHRTMVLDSFLQWDTELSAHGAQKHTESSGWRAHLLQAAPPLVELTLDHEPENGEACRPEGHHQGLLVVR